MMLPRLDSYDWHQAFGYCGEPGTDAHNVTVAAATGYEGPVPQVITRENVNRILAIDDGENDQAPWRIVCEFVAEDENKVALRRFMYLEASCDYTGWDCQADGRAWVSDSLEHLLEMGLNAEARDVLRSQLPELQHG